jgi:hypothetical protein
MTEKELTELMYKKHQKMVLSMEEAAVEWGSSYSYVSKLFGGAKSLSGNTILENKIIPPWIKYGERRMWKITDIAKWLVNTESKKEGQK